MKRFLCLLALFLLLNPACRVSAAEGADTPAYEEEIPPVIYVMMGVAVVSGCGALGILISDRKK